METAEIKQIVDEAVKAAFKEVNADVCRHLKHIARLLEYDLQKKFPTHPIPTL